MKSVLIECTCGRKANLASKHFGLPAEEFNIETLVENLGKLICSVCSKAPEFIYNDRSDLLFDLTNLTHCSECENPVPVARLKAVPGTSVCTGCASQGASDSQTPPPHPQPPPDLRTCPRCGSSSEMRQNGQDKSWFIGCSTYPDCRWTRNF